MDLKEKVRTIPNWPKEGVMFRDVTTLLRDKEGFKALMDELIARYKDKPIHAIAGIDARGFITGAVLAYELGLGFIPIRKKGKLPPPTLVEEYDLEYGTDTIEISEGAIKKGDNILLVDDLLATGGTAGAAAKLIAKMGGNILECSFVIDLPDLGGKKKLQDSGYNVFTLIEFDGD